MGCSGSSSDRTGQVKRVPPDDTSHRWKAVHRYVGGYYNASRVRGFNFSIVVYLNGYVGGICNP